MTRSKPQNHVAEWWTHTRLDSKNLGHVCILTRDDRFLTESQEICTLVSSVSILQGTNVWVDDCHDQTPSPIASLTLAGAVILSHLLMAFSNLSFTASYRARVAMTRSNIDLHS
jgi:hypothetical protein